MDHLHDLNLRFLLGLQGRVGDRHVNDHFLAENDHIAHRSAFNKALALAGSGHVFQGLVYIFL